MAKSAAVLRSVKQALVRSREEARGALNELARTKGDWDSEHYEGILDAILGLNLAMAKIDGSLEDVPEELSHG